MRSVAAALAVLEAVSENQPAGVSELARALGLPKSTTHRMLATLSDLGWIRATDDAPTRWLITSKASAIGSRLQPAQELRAAVVPVMRELSAATGETIHFSVPDQRWIVLIDKVEGENEVRTTAAIGHRAPAHATSAGQAVLAALPESVCRTLLSAAPLEALTPKTVVDLDELMAELAVVRERGYARCLQGRHNDVAATGAAVLNSVGSPVGALSISMPVHRFPRRLWAGYGRLVMEAAASCSAYPGIGGR
ncbi:hypothetical protein BJF90_27260 [Pseudonocardia sp. CNS-004]|nr:hypothetical protein BJF90_27260 [Pseudonocardia sp. CNS-004]